MPCCSRRRSARPLRTIVWSSTRRTRILPVLSFTSVMSNASDIIWLGSQGAHAPGLDSNASRGGLSRDVCFWLGPVRLISTPYDSCAITARDDYSAASFFASEILVTHTGVSDILNAEYGAEPQAWFVQAGQVLPKPRVLTWLLGATSMSGRWTDTRGLSGMPDMKNES